MNHKETILNKAEIERTVEEMMLKKKRIKITIRELVIQDLHINAIEYKGFFDLSLFSLNTRRELVKRFLLKVKKLTPPQLYAI